LKSKFLFFVLIMVAAIYMPMTATCQVAPDRVPKEPIGPVYKNEAYIGWGYTSLNQVSQSRSGLQGLSYSYTRNLTEHFGLAFDGGSYRWDVSATNEGSPTVDLFLAGPVFRVGFFEKVGGFAHVLLGGAHTGGVAIQPDVSFAGGVGLGLDYNKNPRWSFRVYGDEHFLAEIWPVGSVTGRELPKSRAERELARKAQDSGVAALNAPDVKTVAIQAN